MQPAIRVFSGILFQSTLYCCYFVCYFPRKFLYAVETITWLIFFLKKKKKKKNKRRKKSVGWKVAEHCIFCTHITNFLLKDIGKERSQSKNTSASLARFRINKYTQHYFLVRIFLRRTACLI